MSREHVDLALGEQKDGSTLPLGRLLVKLGAIDEATLADVLARQFGLPLIDLAVEVPDPRALASLPRDAALELQALPLRYESGRLVVVVAEPPTRGLRQALAQCTHETVRFAVAPAEHLANAITLAYAAGVHSNGDASRPPGDLPRLPAAADMDALIDDAMNDLIDEDTDLIDEPTPGADPPDADNVVMWLLARAIDDGATSVHIEGEAGGVWVRSRGKHLKQEDLRLPAAAGATLLARVLVAAGLDPTVTSPQAGTFRAEDVGLAHEVRVTSAQTRTGCKVVVRLEPGDGMGFGLDALDAEATEAMRAAVGASRGLVVVAGPPGSGRSTTVRALLAEADPVARSVVTIEDPPGPLIPRVAQLRLGGATGLTAVNALHAASALDADIISIDAPSDASLIGAAVDTALSSQLVLLVLEAPDAWSALARLTQVVDPFLVAAAVTLVLAQLGHARLETLVVSDAIRERLMCNGEARIKV